MVKHYSDFQAKMKKEARRERYLVATLKESLRAIEMQEINEAGQMMNETQWMQWAVNEPMGEKISYSEAQLQWQQWSADPEKAGCLTDVRYGKRRFAVPKETQVNKRTQLIKEKAAEMESKRIKKPTEADIASLSGAVQQRHEEMALSRDVQLDAAAQHMLSAGARGSAFEGAASLLGDVKNLMHKDSDDEEDIEAEEGAEGQEDGSKKEGADATPKKVPKVALFDCDRVALLTKRELEKQLNTKVTAIRDVLRKIEKGLQGCREGAGDPHKVSFFKAEVALCDPRITAAQKIHCDDKVLQVFKDSFVVQSPMESSPAAGSGAASVSTTKAIRSAPPTPTLKDLKSVKSISLFIETNTTGAVIVDRETNKRVGQELREMLVPYTDLVKSCNDAMNALKKRKEDYETEPSAVAAPKNSSTQLRLLASCSEVGEEMGFPACENFGLVNFSKPAVVRRFAQHLTGAAVSKSYTDWKRAFKRDVLDKGVGGRRTFELSAASITEVAKTMDDNLLNVCDIEGFVGNECAQHFCGRNLYAVAIVLSHV